MEEIRKLVTRARSGDLDAYGQLVRRFRDMAFGYAQSILGDRHLAEDAAQEAFLQAYRDLSKLREPAAFPGWLRRIVTGKCDRMIRSNRGRTVPLSEADAIEAPQHGPGEGAEARELQAAVMDAIRSLPAHQRTATTLFYINGYSQRDVADFLEVPPSTVKTRLAAARKRLKERMWKMVDETMKAGAPGEEFPEQILRLLQSPRLLEIDGHPVRKVWQEVQAALAGWNVVEGPEVADATTWGSGSGRAIGDGAGTFAFERDRMLRPTTTVSIVDAMGGRTPPFRILCAGRVFRQARADATRSPVFHQASGVHVGPDVDEESEMAALTEALGALTGPGEIVAEPHESPWLRSRGWELYVERGGRRQGVASAGVLLPEIIAGAGYDPAAVGAFAFGMGLEALLLWRQEVDDIRKLWAPPYVPE